MRIGFHFPFSGSLNKLKERVSISRGNTFQFFARGLRGGTIHPILKKQKKEYTEFLETRDIQPVLLHAPYVYNLTQETCPDIDLILEDLTYAQGIGVDYYIIHPGSAKKVHPILALENVKKRLVEIIDKTEFTGKILVKNMSGAGTEIGFSLEEWNELISYHPRIKGILDVARAYSAGYDTRTLYNDVLEHVGWEKIEVLVLLDNDRPPGSHKNIFAPLGEGMIRFSGFEPLLSQTEVKEKVWIVENQPSLAHTDATLRFLMAFHGSKEGDQDG